MASSLMEPTSSATPSSATPSVVELKTVTPLNRTMVKEDGAYAETLVECARGGHKLLVAHAKGENAGSGNSRPAILTYHDLGLNYVSNFQAFFNFPETKRILRHFDVYHVNAPGQQQDADDHVGANNSAENAYPTMEELAEQINDVLNRFGVVKYIGLGVGLGANVLIRHALKYPERVDSLALVNATCSTAGWIEWGYQKRNMGHLRQHGVTQAVLDYLLWHHFGSDPDSRAHDLVATYR